MRILLIQKPGVDLYRTLYDSDTSRAILRFYRPGRYPWGVEITTFSLGSALSLISEMRWYMPRYIQEVLIEVKEGLIISRSLAREVYQRDLTLTSPWPHRMRYRLQAGKIRRSLIEEGGETPPGVSVPEIPTPDTLNLEVWTTPDEPVEDVVAEEEPSAESSPEGEGGEETGPGAPEAGQG